MSVLLSCLPAVTIHGSGVAGHMALAVRYSLPCLVGRGKDSCMGRINTPVLRLRTLQP